MRIVIFGAGAIGGYLGGILTAAGADVTLVARGAQYDALATRGVKLEGPRTGTPAPIRVNVCRPGEERGPYDLVWVGLKSHQIAGAAAHIAALAGKDGAIVMPQNGLPWWYFDLIDTPYRGTRLRTLDPDGVLSATFDPRQIIGGVAFKPTDLYAPGCIRLADSPEDKLSLGEVDNRMTGRLAEIAALIGPAGWNVVPTDDIRKVKWGKLLSNAVWNTLGSISQSTATHLAQFAGTRAVAIQMIEEIHAVAASVGVKLDGSATAIVDGVAKRAPMLSSTLQDVRAGKALELDAIINSIIEIGGITGVRTPTLAVVAAAVNMLNLRIQEDGIAVQPVRAGAGK